MAFDFRKKTEKELDAEGMFPAPAESDGAFAARLEILSGRQTVGSREHMAVWMQFSEPRR